MNNKRWYSSSREKATHTPATTRQLQGPLEEVPRAALLVSSEQPSKGEDSLHLMFNIENFYIF